MIVSKNIGIPIDINKGQIILITMGYVKLALKIDRKVLNNITISGIQSDQSLPSP